MRDIIRTIRANLTGIEIEIADTKYPATMDYEQCYIFLGNVRKEVDNLFIAIKKDEQGLGSKGK